MSHLKRPLLRHDRKSSCPGMSSEPGFRSEEHRPWLHCNSAKTKTWIWKELRLKQNSHTTQNIYLKQIRWTWWSQKQKTDQFKNTRRANYEHRREHQKIIKGRKKYWKRKHSCTQLFIWTFFSGRVYRMSRKSVLEQPFHSQWLLFLELDVFFRGQVCICRSNKADCFVLIWQSGQAASSPQERQMVISWSRTGQWAGVAPPPATWLDNMSQGSSRWVQCLLGLGNKYRFLDISRFSFLQTDIDS